MYFLLTIACAGDLLAPTIWYIDRDGDGAGDASLSLTAVAAPPGTVANSMDCDDLNCGESRGCIHAQPVV